jgi:hypothetical protein
MTTEKWMFLKMPKRISKTKVQYWQEGVANNIPQKKTNKNARECFLKL